MRSQLVATYRDLRRHVRELQDKYAGTRLVFRGQMGFHEGKVIPSIQRSGHENYIRDEHSFWHTVAAGLLFDLAIEYERWLHEGSGQRKVRHGVHSYHKRRVTPTKTQEKTGAQRPLSSHIDQILQHYGARSHYVDVTKSLTIGLWFAHHMPRHEEVALLPAQVPSIGWKLEPFGPMPVYDVAWYEPAWPKKKVGYLLVLGPNIPEPGKLKHGDYIDLTPNYMAARMERQQAGLLYAEYGNGSGDLRPFVRQAFRFRLPLDGAPSLVTKAKSQTLFPSPKKDIMYRGLLSRMPFRNDVATPYAFHRALRIPEYHDSFNLRASQWAPFRDSDRYFQRLFFFPLLKNAENSVVTCELGGTRFQLKDARPVVCPLSIQLSRVPISDLGLEFNDAEHGFFFEYDPIVTGLTVDDQYSPQNARGIWIVRQGKHYWCRVFMRERTGEAASLVATGGHAFILQEGGGPKLVSVEAKAGSDEEWQVEEERGCLIIGLGLLLDVASGKRSFIVSEVEPYFLLTEMHVMW